MLSCFIIQVNVNGREFYLFQHRMPLERVCALEIGGDVSIDSINIIGVRINCLFADSLSGFHFLHFQL